MRNINWVFGQNAGLHFSGGVTPFSNIPLNTIEGCASISDTNGNLIIYTNGVKVMDAAGNVRATGLLSHPSASQGAVIVPNPANPKQYYVFTTDECLGTNHFNGILIDTSSWISTPLSSLMTMPPTAGFSPTEKLIAIRHATNPKFFWVLTLIRPTAFLATTGPGTLRVFLVDSTGVHHVSDQALNQNIGDVGYMKASRGGRRIGIANFSLGNVLVFPFSSSSGTISPSGVIKIPCIPVPSPHNAMCPYGIEFSPSGEVLYYTTVYPLGVASSPTTDSLVYQYLLPSGPPILVGAHPRGSGAAGDACALQFGSDGRIYIAQALEQKLGVIAHPDLFGAACGLTFSALPLMKTSTCKYGLPNMIRELF